MTTQTKAQLARTVEIPALSQITLTIPSRRYTDLECALLEYLTDHDDAQEAALVAALRATDMAATQELNAVQQ